MHTVKILKRTFKMDDEDLKNALAIASSKVECGIYAIEYRGKDLFEMINEPMSKTQLKKTRAKLKKQGIKIYANGI